MTGGTAGEIEALAARFWARAGMAGEVYPRAIERAVSRALPVEIVKLSEVTVGRIGEYLARRGVRVPMPSDRRDFRGCLYADGGHGIIFVCGDDDPAEQRFTIAHDAAHFVVDYQLPRERVIDELGEDVAEVLDGRRHATVAERGAAVLAQVRVGPHVHLLPRSGRVDDERIVWEAESRADLLGLELVAPREAMAAMLARIEADYAQTERQCEVLAEYFGVPATVLRASVVRLRPQRRPPSFLDEAAVILGARGGRRPTP